jgi:UTP--glucose-1-phosphate uridylyltransferase
MHGLHAAEEKLRIAGEDATAIEAFRRAYRTVAAGGTTLIAEDEIEPVTELPSLGDLGDRAASAALDATVVVKVNGGLGTSMGLDGPKSLLPAIGGRTFLDLIAAQLAALRERTGARLPLLLMNSFATREATVPGARTFLQAREPKLLAGTLDPVTWPARPELEWCPPGHGDVYRALGASGLLDELLADGYERVFLSNADNLAAVPDPRIAAWMEQTGAPFVSEQVERTAADRKGGHIARRRADGRLILRETAQTPPGERDDLDRHPFAHPNNLWVDLTALRDLLAAGGGVLDLPVIANPKTVDPADPSTPAVLQLETAMGAAIGLFDGARALHVPRDRFAPVKTTDDLLLLRSDAYELGDDLVPRPVGDPPLVTLDPEFFGFLRDFEARFPHGPPSLREATSFTVRGDVTFGDDVVVRGDVEVDG